jgi:hypothetical protein
MSSQLVIWTAIPNGTASNGNLLVSVQVSPRLDASSSPGDLGQFPDWVDWPATPVHWHVKINGVSHAATLVSTPSTTLWKALFPPTTSVGPYDYRSLTGRRLFSYPSLFVRNFFATTYPELAKTTPSEWPQIDSLLKTSFGELPLEQDREQSIIQTILSMFPKGGGPIAASASPHPETDLLQAKLFLQPLVVPPAGSSWPVARPPVPDIDFHKAIGLIGRHPALQRLFRLVFDLELVRPAGSFPSNVSLQAEPSWAPITPATNVLPTISTHFSSWRPAPRTSQPELDEGYLRLSDPEYGTIEMDLDGATLKALDFVQSVFRATTSMKSADTPTAYATPSLRSAGLSVTRTANAAALYGALQNSDAINTQATKTPPGPTSLAAEDVTQGYRIDVWDSVRNKWFQLCARSGTPHPGPGGYVVGSPGHMVPVPAGDEGWVELGLTSAGSPTSTDQYLAEALFRWAGWSLIAGRPGKHLSEDPSDGLVPDDYNPATGPIKLQIDYSATPGTLPVLRFGRRYRFRARAVDLAGNSVPFSHIADAASFGWATTPAFYGRLEPVPSPFVVPTAPRTPGEHLERLVIRSNYNIPDSSPTIAHSARHIVPPVTSVEMADQHGILDDASGVPTSTLYAELAARDGLTYTTASVVSSLDGKFDTQPMNNGLQWVYYSSEELDTPYMPDVISRGAALQFLPGVPATQVVTKIPFVGSSWPHVAGFRLDVGAGSGAPVMPSPANSYTLAVQLPKATFQTIRLSSWFKSSDLVHMGLWNWLAEAGDATAALGDVILQGRHWMFTPYRQVVLVHAVKQPLLAPDMTIMSESRVLGATYAYLDGSISYHPASTSRLDVYSAWSEPFDDGTSATGSVELKGNARVGELTVNPGDVSPYKFGSLREDFGDTKHREVYYETKATTSFLEYFTETADAELTGTTPTVVDAAGFAPGTVLVAGTGALDHERYSVNVDYTEDDAAGSLRRVASGHIASGAKVQVSYATPSIVRTSLESDAHPPHPSGYLLSLPSTARPLVPDVRYLLPAFVWESRTAPQVTSARIGHRLRVYLGRPWWETGQGELLGVVVADQPLGVGFPAELQPFVTGYGRDPLFISGKVKPSPAVTDFPLAVTTQTGLFLAEQSETFPTVAVAGHAVQWEPERKLWFADIEIQLGNSYWPFVKLALVRYQPASLAGIEVSRVVQADFAQLGANRVATLTFPTSTSVDVRVVGESYSESNGVTAAYPPNLWAWPQVQIPHVTDPDLQWETLASSAGTQLVGKYGADSITTWTGTVTLPAARGSRPMRILIEEREQYPAWESYDETLRTTYLDTIDI